MGFAIFTAFLLMLYVLLIGWYRWAWGNIQAPAADESPTLSTSISIIIPARNESANIGKCLAAITAQQYPGHLLEVLVIDDNSEDDTALIVAQFAAKYSMVRSLQLATDHSTTSHKKRAISMGIAASRGDLIVCTDADCTAGPYWLSTLAARYEAGNIAFMAGPVRYETKSNVLSVFQTLDFMTMQGITGAGVSKRFHTMCNGANIAYARMAFEEVNGFEGIDRLPTGDDMLLMYKIYQRYPHGVIWLKDSRTIVTTRPCVTWSDFLQQRIRWASKAAFFDDKRIFFVLLLVYCLNLSLLAVMVVAFWQPQLWKWWLAMVGVKTLAEGWMLWPVAIFFEKRQWLPWFPMLQPLHIVYTVLAGFLGRFGSYRWKGRIITPAHTTPNA